MKTANEHNLTALGTILFLVAACGIDSAEQYLPGSNTADPTAPGESSESPRGDSDGPHREAGSDPQREPGTDDSSCPKGTAPCGGSCVDVSGDAQNCGTCGTTCGEGQGCRDGICNQHAWSETLAGEHIAEVTDVAVGPKGEIVAVGSYTGSLELAGAVHQSGAGRDAFVLQMDPDGKPLALQVLGGKGDQSALGVAIDTVGNIAVVGSFEETMRVGELGLESAGNDDAFVAVLSTDARWRFAVSFGDAPGADGSLHASERQEAVSAAFDSKGHLLVAGNFLGSIDIGGTKVMATQDSEMFVAKLTWYGDLVWTTTATGEGMQVVEGLAIDAQDAVAIAGWFTGELPLRAAPLEAEGSSDAFVAKLDSEGAILWSRNYGDGAAQMATGVAVDPETNEILVAGGFESAIDLGGGVIPAQNTGYEIFVARLSEDGAHRASTAFVGDGSQLPSDIAVNARGETLLVGSFHGALDFGSGWMVASSYGDAFVARLGYELRSIWSHRYPGRGKVEANAVAAQGERAIVGGGFGHAVDLGATLISAAKGIFVAAFQP